MKNNIHPLTKHLRCLGWFVAAPVGAEARALLNRKRYHTFTMLAEGNVALSN